MSADPSMPFGEWVRSQVDREEYWFHQMEILPGLVTPGWSEPVEEKVPYFHLPEDMTGLRVLDIGCADGFFSFEAERRGAAQVIAIDSSPHSVRRFNICRAALDSRATAFLVNVYDLSPRQLGTFDVVMCFGVLYHLRNPLLALERIFSISSGRLFLQTASFEEAVLGDAAAARFHPAGLMSGTAENPLFDPTVFWVPNEQAVRGMLSHVGFVDVDGETNKTGAVIHAAVPAASPGAAPDESKAPWC